MSRLAVLFPLALAAINLACGASAPVDDSGGTAATNDSTPSLSLLFVQTGTASFDGDSLVLTGIPGHAVMFSDRPDRFAGHVSQDELLALWADDRPFASDPPNASVTFFDSAGKPTTFVGILGRPSLVADRVAYPYTPIYGTPPIDLGSAVVLIDNADVAPQSTTCLEGIELCNPPPPGGNCIQNWMGGWGPGCAHSDRSIPLTD